MSSTLLRCARCQRAYYWYSKECQKADWKKHKSECLEHARTLDTIQRIDNSRLRAELIRRQGMMEKWHSNPHYVNRQGPVQALGLQRDPKRGWTHVMAAEIAYTPSASDDFRRHFRVARCGVFLLKDILKDIDTILEKEPGWAAYYTSRHLASLPLYKGDRMPVKSRIPVFTLMYGTEFTAIMRGSIVARIFVNDLGYDPNWRRSMNGRGDPPGPLTLPSRVVDVEMVY
ncbi:hypothetical protein EUX98_g2530 [Antrodiella citrinella]|uniref:MYND-type domain-containing protein n=1 Tax=Antrodiella citrinella TaxID=2447956 RepID=A0A4S4N1N9_9APHY|nr:hypothetical protein EUX98_g2530 [Antrodiella citrinella]